MAETQNEHMKEDHSDPIKIYNIENFESITHLKEYLTACLKQSIPIQLHTANPEKIIMQYVLDQVENDHHLVEFSDSVNILHLMSDIAQVQKKSYAHYPEDICSVLSKYKSKVYALMQDNSPEAIGILKNFFLHFLNHPDIIAIRKSKDHQARSLILNVDKKYIVFHKQLSLMERQRSQAAYWELLESVLDEKQTAVLSIPTEEKGHYLSQALLPDSEYDVPSAEPEHPSRVGVNRTMSFIPSEQKQSILDAFTTDELKNEFIEAFPWGAELHSILKLRSAKPESDLNLLGTSKALPLLLQKAAVKYTLVSLDILGKLAGEHGEYALINFSQIKHIVDDLKYISNLINKNILNVHALEKKIMNKTYKLHNLNRMLYEAQQEDLSGIKAKNNPDMNGFCHINENLVYRLTGFEHQDRTCMLMPQKPESPYLEKIEKMLQQKPRLKNSN